MAGLVLKHQGSRGYLTQSQRQAIADWLKQKNYWHLPELKQHVEDSYGVVFESNQSYYDLFALAGISWKKTQKSNPKKDPELVEKKTGYNSLVGCS
ncbi:helix-turn-helix domain-containing protein [Scytonema sp. PCC 10023]|uniref:helix-turn-helix domain-containing protein n=1 Tax=Scytonema sp. PCC 10023 TaxID=1680591 RepID=UPI0039C725CA